MDKSDIYKNRINKEFNNNKKIYIGYENKQKDYNMIKRKISSIINDNNFIYSKLVHIVIDKKVILKKIIGIYKDNIITIDSEYIPIGEIDDIYI